MIKHCVFIKFGADRSNKHREAIYRAIHELRHRLPGWLGFTAGPNATIEAGMDKGYNGGFIIDFADQPALENYLNDAKHQQIGSDIVAASEGGVEGVMVFDFHCD